ncbi:MAG: hypothetical protein ACQETH_05815 [Candidatus Rifleibacteriota bacterium]
MGLRISRNNQRKIETDRMELCLELYREYRQAQNQQQLAAELEKIGFTPQDFQMIIDRFIYYRTQKSSMDQAFRLMQAFKSGYNVQPARVVKVSGFASDSFKLDAEILAVFENQPDLIEKAFEG